MAAERDAYLESVLIGGREPFEPRLVEHDDAWAATFDRWSATIRGALEGRALEVEHIGSTSVPGLVAKPIVDLLLTVDDVRDEAAYVPPLEAVGLVLRVREPHHRMLRTPERDLHLHVYEAGRQEVRDHLDFRDRLRANAADRALYADTKQRLVQLRWRDMNDYADAKSDVIREVLQRARE